jgi:hypothetical protein
VKRIQNKGLDALDAAKDLLDDYLRENAGREAVSAARHHVSRARAEMMRLLGIRPVRTRQGANIDYLLETVGSDVLLTERRRGATSKPYRTSKDMYDAVVRAVTTSSSPPDFEGIVAALSKYLSVELALHEVRMILRFWQHVRPPILKRQKRKYHPLTADFSASAGALWSKLQSR